MTLQYPVAHRILGMSNPVLFPVPGIPLPPASMTFPLVGLVLRVCPHLFPLPEGLPGTLALLTATISLALYTRVRDKMTPTVGASDHVVHGYLHMGTINLQGLMPQNRIIWVCVTWPYFESGSYSFRVFLRDGANRWAQIYSIVSWVCFYEQWWVSFC